GQHDRQLEVLYVSTAGMMIRLDALRTLGGFDARFPAFREDLDLCWRAWLSGRRVAVVPSALGYHIAAGSRLARPFGKGRPWEARYLAERHTLAALLKNYSAASLAWVLPLVLLLALGKTSAFLVTRRFGDAIAVLRAYAWNVLQLGRTLRRRRIVQSRRQAGDAQLSHLFAPGLPRARAYAEALGNWLAGGSTRALLDETDGAEAEADEATALMRLLRRHPAALTAAALLVVYVLGLLRFMGDGQLVGGDILPWPASPWEFLRSYASPWNGEPAGSGAFASPVQVLLGFLSMLGMGSAWLAQRLVVFGLLPLGWALALRAGRLVTASVWPRILGATLYVVSPVLLGALAQGRLGVLLLGVLAPGLVLLAARAADPATATATAWRSAALLSLGLTAAVAASPIAALPLAIAYGALLAVALRRRAVARQPALCLGMAGLAAFALLSPWLVGVLREGGGLGRVTGNPALPLWRALAGVPEVVPGLGGLAGVVIAASAAGLVAAAVILGLQARPAAVSGLVAVVVVSGSAAWLVTRLGAQLVWTPALLLPAALALAGLAVMAAHYLGGGLRQHAFGPRQLAVLLAAGMLTLGLVGGVARMAGGPWHGLTLDAQVVPAFVTADRFDVGAYRILLLEARDGAVWWDVVPAEGPTMTRFGTTPSRRLLDAIGQAVEGAAGGGDPRAGARLGLLNVRYLVLHGDEPDDGLVEALIRQPALEPLPSGGGRVFRVDSWLPRAAVLSPERAQRLLQTGDPGTGREGVTPLRRDEPGVYRAETVPAGLVVVSEAASPVWRAASERGGLSRRAVDPVNGFELPAPAQAVRVRAAGGASHAAVAVVQALLLLGVLSLALR
ncbi:MAG TPA: glycosyltransferase, partial [Egibacteraceae bacterium]|nr:glycosyltransferase [Egibacteraceae bacterium]